MHFRFLLKQKHSQKAPLAVPLYTIGHTGKTLFLSNPDWKIYLSEKYISFLALLSRRSIYWLYCGILPTIHLFSGHTWASIASIAVLVDFLTSSTTIWSKCKIKSLQLQNTQISFLLWLTYLAPSYQVVFWLALCRTLIWPMASQVSLHANSWNVEL